MAKTVITMEDTEKGMDLSYWTSEKLEGKTIDDLEVSTIIGQAAMEYIREGLEGAEGVEVGVTVGFNETEGKNG